MKLTNRREALLAVAGSCSSVLLAGARTGLAAASTPTRSRLGIVIYALGIHQKNGWAGRHEGLPPALAFLEECQALGAGGIQCALGPQDARRVRQLRRRAEDTGLFFEAILEPPRDEADVARFEQDVRLAKEAGASVARTAVLPGRRYEQFKSLAEFRNFERRGLRALRWAEPVLARERFRLAIENHKDQRVPEKLALLKRLSSEWIGLCVDVVNNLALLEDPMETVRALAPWAFTVHLKDAGVREYDGGFLLADAALGEGFLDLPAIVRLLREAKPTIRFTLETITRDALKVPVKTEGYWASFDAAARSDLAPILKIVRAKASPTDFPSVSALPVEAQLALERRNLERSLEYARARLDL